MAVHRAAAAESDCASQRPRAAAAGDLLFGGELAWLKEERMRRWHSIAVVLAATLPADPAPRLLEPPTNVAYCPTTIGAVNVYRCNDEWEYTETVTGVVTEGVTKVVTVSRRRAGQADIARCLLYEVSARGLVLAATKDGETRPPDLSGDCLLRLPHRPGGQWTRREPRRGGGELRLTWTAGATEVVRVPAGTFEAIPVVYEFDDGINCCECTCWYAPGIGLVKRVELGGAVVTELRAHAPGAK